MKRLFLAAALVGGLFAVTSCGPSRHKMMEAAKQQLALSVSNPEALEYMGSTGPDSAFGSYYFTDKEMQGILTTMHKVSETIMQRTKNMSQFNPNDRYVMMLADRQMQASSEVRQMMMKRLAKGKWTGWKIKMDYKCKDDKGQEYRAERWFFLDKKGKTVYKTIDIPLP